MKRQLDAQLWDFSQFKEPYSGRLTMAVGKNSGIYQGWRVCVYWNTIYPGWHVESDVCVVPTLKQGWTGISIYSNCQRAELGRVRELFRYTFRVK